MSTPARVSVARRLTDNTIKAWLLSGAAKPLHDGGGLYLRRMATGAFWALRQVNPHDGRRTWAGLFPGVAYPVATLAEARRVANEARLRACEGTTDLVRERSAAREAGREAAAAAESERARRLTVRDLFDRWAGTELAPQRGTDGRRIGRKDGGAYTRAQFTRRVFPTLGATAATDVRKADLLALLDRAKAEGRLRTANVLLADLKQMFRFALAREIVERNPLDTVTKREAGGPETERDRVLSADEVQALSRALPAANMSPRSVLAVWLILATGCRVSEAMGATWAHVDVAARCWHLPQTKNERPHDIHLSDFALQQFEGLRALRTSDREGRATAWVFPNTSGDGPVCPKSFGKQLADRQRVPQRRMQHRSKTTQALALSGGKWTAHDLRRTAATVMAELGVSGDVIDECLNHVIESRVRRTYIRDRRRADQARAFDALGARLSALTTGQPVSNVVQLRAA